MSQERVWKEKAGIKTLARISSGGGQAFQGNRKRNRIGLGEVGQEKGSVIFNNPADMLTAGVHTLSVLVPFIALRLVACRLASSRKTVSVRIPIRTHKLLARFTRRLRTLAVFVPLDTGRKIARLCLNRKRRHPTDDNS